MTPFRRPMPPDREPRRLYRGANMRISCLATLVLVLAVAPSASAAADDGPRLDPQAVRAALAGIDDDSMQRSFPGADTDEEAQPTNLRIPVIVLPAEIMQLLWYIAIFIATFWIVRIVVVPLLPGEKEVAAGTVADGEEISLPDLPLPDHRLLAKQGRYGDAVHVLLLGTLLVLARRLRTPLPVALTSREVLGRWRLGMADRDDLAGMVGCVERGHFGLQDMDADEYRDCLERSERLAAARRETP